LGGFKIATLFPINTDEIKVVSFNLSVK